MNAQLQIKDGHLIIALPLTKEPSKSRKNTLIASTHGNKVTTFIHDGKPVTLSVNAYIPA